MQLIKMRAVDLILFAICVILSPRSAAVNGFTFNTQPSTAFPPMTTSSEYGCILPQMPDNGYWLGNQTNGVWTIAFYCDSGYRLVGTPRTTCSEQRPQWIPPEMPVCLLKTCTQPTAPTNGGVYVNATSTDGQAVYFCDVGFLILGSPIATCLFNETWSAPTPQCFPLVCPSLTYPDNGHVDVVNETTHATLSNVTSAAVYGAIAKYSCDDGYSIMGVVTRMCLHTSHWSDEEPRCRNVPTTIKNCPPDKDARGTNWEGTEPGQIAVKHCKNIRHDSEGRVTRDCTTDGIWRPPVYSCRKKKFAEAAQEISAIVENPTESGIENVLFKLANLTETDDDSDGLFEAEVEEVTSFLTSIVNVSKTVNVTETQSESFVSTTSNILDRKHEISWNSISQTSDNKGPTGAVKVLQLVDEYAETVAASIQEGRSNRTMYQKNMDVVIVRLSKQGGLADITYPPRQSEGENPSELYLPKEALNGSTSYSAVLYKDLTGVLPANPLVRVADDTPINSPILSLTLMPANQSELTHPVKLTFGHLKKNYANPTCSYLDFESNAWGSDGCTMNSTSDNVTVCYCHHLTNFAVLMSPWSQDNVDSLAIAVITYVGCSLSSVCLLITAALHIFLWRYVKGDRVDRVIILLNLVTALIISYVIFLAGVRQSDNEDVCTAVALMLQYIYLVVFFLMLAEGVEIACVTVLFIFATRSRLKWLLPLAWGLPVLIVAVSAGITRLDGYGTKDFCWLSTENGLIWSFVAPALLIIIINFAILLIVIRAMMHTKMIAERSRTFKIKAGIRCLCVLLPLMGCSWVLGVFYVSERTAWIQYVFALCNSLQGVVIFIFHCLSNEKIKSAINLKLRRRRYSDSIPSTKQTKSSSTADKPETNPKVYDMVTLTRFTASK